MRARRRLLSGLGRAAEQHPSQQGAQQAGQEGADWRAHQAMLAPGPQWRILPCYQHPTVGRGTVRLAA